MIDAETATPYLAKVGGQPEVNQLELSIGLVRLEHPVLQLRNTDAHAQFTQGVRARAP